MDKATGLKDEGNKEFVAKNYLRASQLYSQAISLREDPSYYANRAACYINLKRFAPAVEDCKKAIALDDKPAKPYYRLAAAHAALGNLKAAFDTLKAGCINHPNEVNMLREYDNLQILLGYKEQLPRLVEEQQLPEALKKVSSLLEKCEMDVDLLILKIQLLCKTGDPKAAQSLLTERENFIELKSEVQLKILDAMVERYMNKLDESKKKLELAIIQFAEDADDLKRELKHVMAMEAIKEQGNNAFRDKKFADAIQLYDDCLLLDPYNGMWKATICSNKASCYMALKETKAALDLMKTATNFDPSNAKSWYKRGKLEKDVKEWEMALNSMRKAKSLDSTLTIDADIKLISDALRKQDDKNYYDVMGIPQTAAADEVKTAYKKLVRKYHPDLHHTNEEDREKNEKIFKLVNEANEVLSDPKKRKQYDDNGCKKVEDGGGMGGHGHFGGFGVDPNDLLQMLFMNGGGAQFRSGGRGGSGRGSGGGQGHSFQQFRFQ